jgi:hypothetical protein
LAATGIGYAGLDGAWWLPAAEPFRLPSPLHHRLLAFADAIVALLDVVRACLARDAQLHTLLTHKVPPALVTYGSSAPVLALRPDFQIVSDGRGHPIDVAATELEICPSAQGFAHAMQVAAGLPTDLVEITATLLAGRSLLIVGSAQWSEFLFDQLAFCRALEEAGATARLLYDRPLAELDAEVEAGVRWRPPIFGIEREPQGWQRHLSRRLTRSGLARYWLPAWPREVGRETVLFRFGYLETFDPAVRGSLRRWESQGTTALNPAHFAWENKAVMAALSLPAIRAALHAHRPAALPVLDAVLPETLLVTESTHERLVAEQPGWVLKFAGFDGGNQAWGGRSLQVGASLAAEVWRTAVDEAICLPWPVVAQRLIPSMQATMRHVGGAGGPSGVVTGPTRLRSFFLRAHEGSAVQVAGVHVTVSPASGGVRVSEALESVQAPAIFAADA